MTSYRDFTSKDVIFLISLLLMRVALGLYATVFGIALLDMAQLIGVSQQDISIIIPAKSVGSGLGAILVGIYFHYLPFKKLDRVTALGLVHFVYAGLCVAIPFSNSVAMIGVLTVISGMGYGILDIGYLAIVVDTWGKQLAGSMAQLYSLGWVVGSFIGPYIFEPFLNVESDSDICNVTSMEQSQELQGGSESKGVQEK